VVSLLQAARAALGDDGDLRDGADRAHDEGLMIAVLSGDFVRTARASGLGPATVLIRYALRNALLPVVTTLGMVFGFMIGSSVIIEKVVGWPGVGGYAIDALTASDCAPVRGFVLAMGVLFVLLNLLVDLRYLLINPRVSIES
jgi:peptide/nickel transport system permease protein